MAFMNVVAALIVGYAFGCIQTAYLLGRIFGKMDIRDEGSGNAGASNVTMVMGWKFGILTGLVDVLKGVAPVLIMKALYPGNDGIAFLAGLGAIAGHIFPFYLGFKGGKGVATLLGMLLGYDARWGALFVAVMVALPLVFDYIVVGSLTVFTGLPILTYGLALPPLCLILAITLTVIALAKHAENIQRIRAGEEVRVSQTMKRK